MTTNALQAVSAQAGRFRVAGRAGANRSGVALDLTASRAPLEPHRNNAAQCTYVAIPSRTDLPKSPPSRRPPLNIASASIYRLDLFTPPTRWHSLRIGTYLRTPHRRLDAPHNVSPIPCAGTSSPPGDFVIACRIPRGGWAARGIFRVGIAGARRAGAPCASWMSAGGPRGTVSQEGVSTSEDAIRDAMRVRMYRHDTSVLDDCYSQQRRRVPSCETPKRGLRLHKLRNTLIMSLPTSSDSLNGYARLPPWSSPAPFPSPTCTSCEVQPPWITIYPSPRAHYTLHALRLNEITPARLPKFYAQRRRENARRFRSARKHCNPTPPVFPSHRSPLDSFCAGHMVACP
ncbi:hypothetical protein C8R45DRAFT_1090365 [Mycena sanguinolenta]|nr:hypothetical protein C8R45DRAFT_1090365 [Mycena sanguinolenta]